MTFVDCYIDVHLFLLEGDDTILWWCFLLTTLQYIWPFSGSIPCRYILPCWLAVLTWNLLLFICCCITIGEIPDMLLFCCTMLIVDDYIVLMVTLFVVLRCHSFSYRCSFILMHCRYSFWCLHYIVILSTIPHSAFIYVVDVRYLVIVVVLLRCVLHFVHSYFVLVRYVDVYIAVLSSHVCCFLWWLRCI